MPNKPPQKSSRNEIFPHFSSHNQFFTLTLQPNKNKTMKNIFKIKKEERILALVSMLVFASLNTVLIHSYPANFFKAGKLGFWSIFYKHFTVSGFDAYSYIFLSNEKIYFELSRHPLFGALLYPGACLNDWLMGWTHHNCATFIMAVMLVISATFSAVFFFRICRELIQLCRLDAYILTAFFFSFASIMLTTMVPDHFCFSMLCLLVSIYMVGTCMAQGKQLKAWQASLLFLTTAGVSLSNGVKTGIISLFSNGRKVFSPRFFAIAFILPLLIMGGSFYYQNEYIVKPQQEKGKEIERKLMPKRPDIAQKNAVHDAWMDAHRGKSVSDMPFLKWTDVSTPRMESIVENLFGEGIQLHQKELLKDLSVSRPTFIRYDWAISYIFEAFVFLLFAAGVFYSRHSRLMWMCLSCAAFDTFLHLVLGFGLNEVYIMAAHWMFVIPFTIGYAFREAQPKLANAMRGLTLFLAIYFWAYNATLIITHFL